MLYRILLCMLLFVPPVFAAPFDSATFNKAGGALAIQRITPEGEDVPPGRQIVFQFNRPVVPVGKMDRDKAEIPISITPALECEWRWLNTSALACQLTEKNALKYATRYQVAVQPGIKAEDGATLTGPHNHSFITKRPDVSYTSFNTWTGPGMPLVRVSFNQPVSKASVEAHLFFQTNKRVAARAELPKPDPEGGDEYYDEYDEEGNLIPPPVSDKPKDPQAPVEYARAWILSPKQLLPEDTHVALTVEPGLISELGPETGVENRAAVEFDTFPAFKFLGVKCADLQEEEIFFEPSKKPSTQRRCNPLRSAALVFSAPVIKEVVRDNLTLTPDLAGGRKDYDPWAKASSYSRLNSPHSQGNTYITWLPEILKAYQTYRVQAVPQQFKDEFGRSLPFPIDMQFLTDHRKPTFTFEHDFSVLEKGVDSEVPLYVTNLNKIDLSYTTLTAQGAGAAQSKTLQLPKLPDISYKVPFETRSLINAPSGVVQASFTTDPATDNGWNTWFFTQVTPFHVQVKAGHYNTLVWVTDFATGLPVPGVEIGIYQSMYQDLQANPPILASGVTGENGVAMLDGIAKIDPKLEFFETYGKDQPHLFVRARKGEDLALVPMDYPFGVDMYELSEEYISNWSRKQYGHIHAWGTTAQGVYKAGDTVQYKLFVRDQDNRRFVAPPRDGFSLTVMDPMGKTVHEVKNLSLSEFGSFAGEFTVPKSGAVGWYQFELVADFDGDQGEQAEQENNNKLSWQPLRVLISDFTPSPFRVRTELNGQLFRQGDQVSVTTRAELHSGGPYGNAHSKFTAILAQADFMPQAPVAKGFQFDTWVSDHGDEETIQQSEGDVNSQGLREAMFTLSDSWVLYGTLRVEGTVRDERGKDVAHTATANYVGRDRFVGLKQTEWLAQQGKPSKTQVLVVDPQGQPMAGVPFKISVERRETKAARVKGAGNAYLTQYTQDWVKLAESGANSTVEPSTSEFIPDQPGYYRITARIQDSQNREHKTEMYQWVSGKGSVVWETGAGNGMKVMPEKESYKVGETARFLIQNPFPGAQALITIERYGVLKSWVQTFPDSVQLIEVPVEADFIPGFFLSATVMSPRVAKPLDDQGVDLGKPAFRMGYAKMEVKDPYKELVVDIKTDKQEYRPRQKVTVNVQARPRQAGVQAGPVELAVVVLDESVFDLIGQGRDYFDPYKGFYTLDDLDMRNFNILMRLVGRQKFEKKGATPGGDGGVGLALRSVFKFVSYWNPSQKTDAEGKAWFQFEVPDNLTGWRILVMAVTPDDLMGLGDANFKVNQPIEVRPVMPNQVTTGDSFQAGFNITNRTDKTRSIQVSVSAEGAVQAASTGSATGASTGSATVEQTVTVEPFKRQTVWLPIKTSQPGEIKFIAQATSTGSTSTGSVTEGVERDAVTHTLIVGKRRSLETGATYGTTEQNEVTENLQFPKDIYPDTGGVSVVLGPTVISNVEGAFEYMRDYPYACWEQKLSKGVMASHYQNLKAWLPDSLVWKDAAALPKKTLEQALEFQAPNGGMAFYIPQDQYVSPYLSAYTALAFGWLRDAGLEVPDEMAGKLDAYLQELLRKDAMPDFYSAGMASSVRAVALHGLSKRGKATLGDLKRYAPALKQMSLFGKASFLSAALNIGGSEKYRDQAAKMILSQAVESGGKITFNEELDDAYTRILASPLRDQCAVLSALTSYANTPTAQGVGQLPVKLARTIVEARKSRTHWENTQENMFCMNALLEYSRVFEKDKPNMQVRVFLDQAKLGQSGFNDARNPPMTFEHPMTAQDPGRKAQVKIEREGQGRLYYAVRMQYAATLEKADPVNAGIEVRREYSVERNGKWELLQSPMTIKTGELVRVDLYLSLPTARNFVVLDDPVPGGLEPVNRDLATASTVAADKAQSDYAGGSIWFQFSDWREYGIDFWSFYHQELRHHAAIFYSDYLPPGNYHLSYAAQAIAPGEFAVMPAHSEEMYEPDVYGKSAPAVLKVEAPVPTPPPAPQPPVAAPLPGANLPPAVAVPQPPQAPLPAATDADLTAKGLTRVAALLTEMGYYAGNLAQPDIAALRQALSALQKDLGMPVNGKLDEATWAKLGTVKLSEERRKMVETAGH